MADKSKQPHTERLVSLDAYRGFVMLAMASSGFALARAFSKPEVIQYYDNSAAKTAWRWLCGQVAFHGEHVAWAGGSFWDMIQPSFMFMVGVALPFSFASRESLGHNGFIRFMHVLQRSVILVLLGVFLSSDGRLHTNFTFVNVLTQIGLGYPIVWLLLHQGKILQLLAASAILGGYWYAFYRHAVPPAGIDPTTVRLPPDWHLYDGIAAHWNKNTNWAAWIDQSLLNYFPQYNKEGVPERFTHNPGGYATLNFIPSIATMIFGLMTGEMLRGERTPMQNVWRMVWTGALCLIIGLAMDPRLIIPVSMDWTVCPIVKRIWTPSWVFYSTGWTLWALATFYWLIDVKGWKVWAFPLTVVGMNSIAIYVGYQLMRGWIAQTLKTHFGQHMFDVGVRAGQTESSLAPILQSAAVLFVLWLMCLWMYRRKIFVRI